MNNGKVVKYDNVKNENFSIFNFNNNGKMEYMLIHDFDTEYGKDYLVIGKFVGDMTDISKNAAVYKEIIKSVITKYKDNKEEIIKYNGDKYYEANIIQNFLFTKEGYDLISHKFLFTNGEILKTIVVEQQEYNGQMYYSNEYHSISDDKKEDFMPFDYYEKYYTLRQEEFQNLDINNIFAYTRANFYKIKNVMAASEVLHSSFREIKGSINDLEALNIMVEAIEAINTLNEKQRNNQIA